MHAVCKNHGFRPLKRGGPGGELALRQAHVKWRSHSGAVWILRFSPVSLAERAIPGSPGMMGYVPIPKWGAVFWTQESSRSQGYCWSFRNPGRTHQLRLVVVPIIYRIFIYIQPVVVLGFLNHQQVSTQKLRQSYEVLIFIRVHESEPTHRAWLKGPWKRSGI